MRNRTIFAGVVLEGMLFAASLGQSVPTEGIQSGRSNQSASSISIASPSPLLPPPPHAVPQGLKSIPQEQTSAEFQKALGVPLEDAGGGTHAILSQNADAARVSLVTAGYQINQIGLNYDDMSADIFIAYKTPPAEDQAAALSAAEGATINFITVMRTAAEAETQQARIDADRAALAKQGIIISTTGIVEDGATVLVTLINGTSSQADYILKTYGPGWLKVSIAGGPIPYES